MDTEVAGEEMNWGLFVHGCIGAAAPEIVRFYNLRAARRTCEFSKFYWAISILYLTLGGYIASIFPGLSAPFWAACIGSGTVLNVNLMVKISELLFRHLAERPSFEESRKRAGRVGGQPAPAKSAYDRAEEVKAAADARRSGDFWDYSRLL